MADKRNESAADELLKKMPVYHSRIAAAQAALETDTSAELDDFHMHCDGEAPLAAAFEHFKGSLTLLDLGCGQGASLLWMARQSAELRALAGVDLLEENIAIARSLARRYMPEDFRSSFFAHDISTLTTDTLADGCGLDEVDAVLSLNVGVHLGPEQRQAMWQFVGQVLTSTGRVYVEDFYRLRETDENEDLLLSEQVACPYLPGMTEYVEDIDNGVEGVTILREDISSEYADFATQRYENYDGDDERKREFYRAMHVLLSDSAIGGLRIRLSFD